MKSSIVKFGEKPDFKPDHGTLEGAVGGGEWENAGTLMGAFRGYDVAFAGTR